MTRFGTVTLLSVLTFFNISI